MANILLVGGQLIAGDTTKLALNVVDLISSDLCVTGNDGRCDADRYAARGRSWPFPLHHVDQHLPRCDNGSCCWNRYRKTSQARICQALRHGSAAMRRPSECWCKTCC